MTAEDQFDCSVVVPSYGGAERLPVLLEAFRRQVTAAMWELIVVLDGTTDDSAGVLARWRDMLPLSVVTLERSSGVAAAMNAGIAAARGRVIIRCDDDLTPAPDFLDRHLKHHRHGLVAVVGPTRDIFPDNGYARLYGRPANDRSLAAAYSRPAEERWLSWAANNSAPRSVLEAVGGFDESFAYGEDFELGYRLHRAGIPILIDSSLEVEHRGPARNVESRAARAFVSGASRKVFERKHPQAAQVPRPPARLPDRVWSGGVRLGGWAVRSRTGWQRVGSMVDRLVDTLPAALSRRLIAWAVEAAGRAGRLHGPADLAVLRGQKDADLAQERAHGPLRITLATNNGDVGGGEVMLLRIAEALRGLAVDVAVVAPEEPSGLADAAEELGLPTRRLNARNRRQWMVALRRWDRAERTGILWCNGLVPAAATAWHRSRIVHLHQQPIGPQRLAAAIARLRALKILVPSTFMQSAVRGSAVLMNWTGNVPTSERARQSGGPFVVGFLGRLSPDKGLLVLADAVRLLRNRMPGGIRLLLAGEPRFVATSDYAKVEAALSGIDDLLERAGWMDRDEFFSRVDVLAMPSVWEEPFGLSAAEAMAAQVPVVVSDAGALPQVVGDGGTIVAAGDPVDLANTIIAVANGTVDTRTADLHQRWRETFSPTAGKNRVEELLRSLSIQGLF